MFLHPKYLTLWSLRGPGRSRSRLAPSEQSPTDDSPSAFCQPSRSATMGAPQASPEPHEQAACWPQDPFKGYLFNMQMISVAHNSSYHITLGMILYSWIYPQVPSE